MTTTLTAQHTALTERVVAEGLARLRQRAAEDEVADRLYRVTAEAVEAYRCPRLQRVCDEAVAAMQGARAWMRGARP